METIKQFIPEFIKAQTLDPEDIIEALTVNSLSELKDKIGSSIKRKKQEMNQMGQLQQQLEQMQQELQ